jgi:hypothetical protein
MSRKKIAIKRTPVIFILLCLLFLIACWDNIALGNTLRYMQVRVANEGEFEDYVTIEAATQSTSLRFDGSPLAYDSETKIYYAAQNMNTENWEGTVTSDAGTLYWKADAYLEQKEQAIAEGHVFTLYQVDEQDKTLEIVPVVFTGMPIMTLRTAEYDEESGEFQGTMRVADPYNSADNITSTECVYHVRGGSSRNYHKLSYKLELSQDAALLGMREDDDWILNALYDDAGLIHNKFSIDVWRSIASDNSVTNDEGVQAEYVELFMDNEYQGVYALMERVDKKELNLAQGSILYKCLSWEVPDAANEEEDYGFGKSFEIKYPKSYTKAQWQPLKRYADAFFRTGDISMEEAEQIMNLENAVDYDLFMMLAYGCDNLRKNTYFVAEPGVSGYTVKKVPWDMNATWGNAWVGDKACNFTLYDPDTICDTQMWCTDMLKLYDSNPEEVTELLLERWQELRKDILSEERLKSRLDEQFAYLHASGAYDRNYARWTNGTEYWDDDYIYEYVEGRLAFLDDYFKAPYFDGTFEFNECIKNKE